MAFKGKSGVNWDRVFDNIANGTVPAKTRPAYVQRILDARSSNIVRESFNLCNAAYTNDTIDREAELDKLAGALKDGVADQDAGAPLALAFLCHGSVTVLDRFTDNEDYVELIVKFLSFDVNRFQTDNHYRGFTLGSNIDVSKYGYTDRVDKTIVLLLWAIALAH